jgi:4-amino-4-deoxy-L-arabinose transferase-like glycosyltransferase
VSGRSDLHKRLMRLSRSPLFWILVAAAVLRTAGIFWGLPASDGWDDDGVAPRNFLVGIAQTYTPGSYFTYPPFHMFLLAILTAPGWIIALVNASALTPHAVIAEMIQVPYMTFFAVVARVVSAAMSIGTIYLIGRIAETTGGRRAGLFAAAACALNAALTYYGQVTNLDGPYLFWAALSVWGWMRAIEEHEPRHIRWAALAAAAAVATKDQAYAVFLISVPLALLAWFALDRWPRQNARLVMASLLLWTGVAFVALLAIDGAITNPTGFAERIAFLTGPASRDYAQYQDDWAGRVSLLKSTWQTFSRFYPSAAIVLAALGISIHALRLREDRARFVAGLMPLLAIISYTIAFDFAALRTEIRFLLPQSIFIAVYIGIAVDKLVTAPQPWVKWGARGLVLAISAYAFYQCAGIAAAFIADPRYDAERWLSDHTRRGDVIETYGLNVYLPRFPKDTIVIRVGQKPLKARNPLPNVTEILQPYESVATRNPRFIVVSAFWVRDYLETGITPSGRGEAIPRVRRSVFADTAGRDYFRALFEGRLPYRLAHKSVYSPSFWPPLNAYESLAQTIFLFERVPMHVSSQTSRGALDGTM